MAKVPAKWSSWRLRAEPETGRLVRHYFLVSLALISGGLIVSGALDLYYSYVETRQQIALLQQEKAQGAALRIAQFVQNIQQGLTTAAKSRDLVINGIGPSFSFELERLLLVAPPISDLVAFDLSGRQAVQASRFKPVSARAVDGRKWQKIARRFQSDADSSLYAGDVDYVRGSEPHLDLAVPIDEHAGRRLGVLFASVDLGYVTDVVAAISIGKQGYAYVVSASGDLVAHPDVSLVLQRRGVGDYPQVKAALAGKASDAEKRSIQAPSFRGETVMASVARVPGLNWGVIIEQPIGEVYETIYLRLFRSAGLVLLGFACAFLASIYLARKVLRPIEALRAGAQRIGQGDWDHRLDVQSGDELEILAGEFNKMTAALKQLYSGLEARVHERTQELRVANDRLQELDRLKSQFLSNVSHELRTPLTAIRSLVDNMRDGLTGNINEKQQFYLTGIRSSSDRLSRLIRDLLDLSVIQSGKIKLHPSRFSLGSLVYEITEGLRPSAQEKAIDLRLPLPSDEMVAWADRDKIAQILTNLLGNAIKFTPAGGAIEIAIEAHGADWAKITVADTGPGIATCDSETIFVEFSQVARPGKEKSPGVGLGLAISKKLVEMHGGEIGVESCERGSTFFFTVPTVSADADFENVDRLANEQLR